MKWDSVQLGEVMDVKHGFAFKGEYFADSGEYMLLTPGNCHETGGLKLRGDRDKFYSGEFPVEFLLSEGDTLVVMTDLVNSAPILGGSFVIPESNRFLHNQRLGLVEITAPGRIDRTYLRYLLNTHEYRAQVRGSASGATVRHTSPGRIKACRVRIPRDVAQQRRIGETLSAYESLVDNNRRRMALLEDAARQLYREWFTRLRFPGHEHTKAKDGVPKGWKRVPLGELADITMGQSPESKYYNAVGDGLPFHQGVTDFGDRFVSHRTYSTALNRTAEAGDILCSVRAPVGRLNVTLDRIVIGRGLAALRSKTGCQSMLLQQLRAHFFKEDLIGGGTIFASVTKQEFTAQQLLEPPDRLKREFEAVTIPCDEQVRVLHVQNERLQTARGLLLPRLMSGEIAV